VGQGGVGNAILLMWNVEGHLGELSNRKAWSGKEILMRPKTNKKPTKYKVARTQ